MADVPTVTRVLTFQEAPPARPQVSITLRPLHPIADKQALLDLYIIAFHSVPEFEGWPLDEVLKQADADITQFLAEPHPASQIAADPDTEAVVGALLITGDGEELRHLMIDPEWQRCGLATALLHTATYFLLKENKHTLRSRYAADNLPSRAWHEAMGFQVVTP